MKKSPATLSGVGLGPGDPDLLTLKALKVIRAADVVFTAVSRQSSNSVSLRIVRSIPDLKAEVVELVFAMRNTADRTGLIRENAEIILSRLREGKDCVFATIGDPLTYSTFGYIMKTIEKTAPEVRIEIVPGVNSWSVLAAESKTILAEDLEPLLILPSYRNENQEIPDIPGTKVLLKTYRSKDQLLDQLQETKSTILYGSNLGLDNEFISTSPDKIRARDDEYLSMIITRNEKTEI